jgi:GNAT superfamily N-acetyltransferase
MARIVRLTELPEPGSALRQADAIFWESAYTKTFADETSRVVYRELWFGRYLAHVPGEFLLALGPNSDVMGYLAGSLTSDAPPLPGPDYYGLFAPELIARFPAHIHVNVHADSRGNGIGAELVRAFADHCRARNVPGLHAVTRQGSRSSLFFEKCGLAPLETAIWRNTELTFLASMPSAADVEFDPPRLRDFPRVPDLD